MSEEPKKIQPTVSEENPLPSLSNVLSFNISQKDIDQSSKAFKKQMKGNEYVGLIDAEDSDFEGEGEDE